MMKKIAMAALPLAGAALVLAAPAGAKPLPPPPPHPLHQLLVAGNNALVGAVGQAEAQVNGTLYNLGFRPYI